MSLRVLAPLRGALTGFLLGLNTVIVFSLMIAPALLKLLAGSGPLRPWCDRALAALASCWVAVNTAWMDAGRSITWGELGLAFTQVVLLLGGLFAVAGIICFNRRELATAQGTQ